MKPDKKDQFMSKFDSLFPRSNNNLLCNNRRCSSFCRVSVDKFGGKRFEEGFRTELSKSQGEHYNISDYCEPCHWLLQDVLNNSYVTDKILVKSLLDSYQQESQMCYDESGEELGLDHNLLDAIEEVVKYGGTKEEASEFYLNYKTDMV